MTDIFSKKKISEIMSKIKNKNTKIEIELRKAIWKARFGFEKVQNSFFNFCKIFETKDR